MAKLHQHLKKNHLLNNFKHKKRGWGLTTKKEFRILGSVLKIEMAQKFPSARKYSVSIFKNSKNYTLNTSLNYQRKKVLSMVVELH